MIMGNHTFSTQAAAQIRNTSEASRQINGGFCRPTNIPSPALTGHFVAVTAFLAKSSDAGCSTGPKRASPRPTPTRPRRRRKRSRRTSSSSRVLGHPTPCSPSAQHMCINHTVKNYKLWRRPLLISLRRDAILPAADRRIVPSLLSLRAFASTQVARIVGVSDGGDFLYPSWPIGERNLALGQLKEQLLYRVAAGEGCGSCRGWPQGGPEEVGGGRYHRQRLRKAEEKEKKEEEEEEKRKEEQEKKKKEKKEKKEKKNAEERKAEKEKEAWSYAPTLEDATMALAG